MHLLLLALALAGGSKAQGNRSSRQISATIGACEVSTVYVPVAESTVTVTLGGAPTTADTVSTGLAKQIAGNSSGEKPSLPDAFIGADKGTFFFTVENGTTIWLGGQSPTSTLEDAVTITSTVLVTAEPQTDTVTLVRAVGPTGSGRSVLTTTIRRTLTVSRTSTSTAVPPSTSVGPTATVRITSTETLRRTLTATLSNVTVATASSVSDELTTTVMETSFVTSRRTLTRTISRSRTGPGTAGWNTTSTQVTVDSLGTAVADAARIPLLTTGLSASAAAINTAQLNSTAATAGASIPTARPPFLNTTTTGPSGAAATFTFAESVGNTAPVVLTVTTQDASAANVSNQTAGLSAVSMTVSLSSTTLESPEMPTGVASLSVSANATNITTVNSGTGVSSVSAAAATGSSVASTLSTAIAPFANVTRTLSNLSTIVTGVRSGSTGVPTPDCGELGNFTLSVSLAHHVTLASEGKTDTGQWDDEPVFTPRNNATATFPPVLNPHKHLFFSNGFGYLPPPDAPFTAVTGGRLAIFLVNQADDVNDQIRGGIGAGPRASNDAFWVNAYGAYLGCLNGGPSECTMKMTGYAWNSAEEREEAVAWQNATLAPCPGLENCSLTPVTFSTEFQGLSTVQIEAIDEGAMPRNWFMDDLRLGWWNDTCEAGQLRSRSRK